MKRERERERVGGDMEKETTIVNSLRKVFLCESSG